MKKEQLVAAEEISVKQFWLFVHTQI